MNKTMLMCAMVAMVGCAGGNANTALRDGSTIDNTKPAIHPDAFDRAGFVMADGSRVVWQGGRWVYDEASKAINWIASDAHKQEAKKVMDTLGAGIGAAWDAAKDEWKKELKK